MAGKWLVVLRGYWIRFHEIDLSDRTRYFLLEREATSRTAIEVARMLLTEMPVELQFIPMLLTVQRSQPGWGRVLITGWAVFRNRFIYLPGMSINYAPSVARLSNLETSPRG